MGEKVQGIRSIICRYKIGEIKNSMGNEEAKELICMTHRHELRWGNGARMGSTGWSGKFSFGRNKWGDCNSIINKM